MKIIFNRNRTKEKIHSVTQSCWRWIAMKNVFSTSVSQVQESLNAFFQKYKKKNNNVTLQECKCSCIFLISIPAVIIRKLYPEPQIVALYSTRAASESSSSLRYRLSHCCFLFSSLCSLPWKWSIMAAWSIKMLKQLEEHKVRQPTDCCRCLST